MDSFGLEKKRISLTEIAWLFAIGYLIWLMIQCPLEGWENLGKLLQAENPWIVFQIITASFVAFTGLFAAFLQDLYYQGEYRIRTAEASLCIFGLLLVLVEQSLIEAGIQNYLPHLWAGRCFMIIGYVLTVYLLIREKKSDLLFIGLNGACLLLLILICIFPQISVYGLVFPLIAVLTYDVILIYKSGNSEKDGSISGIRQTYAERKPDSKETKENTGFSHAESFKEGLTESDRPSSESKNTNDPDVIRIDANAVTNDRSSASGEADLTDNKSIEENAQNNGIAKDVSGHITLPEKFPVNTRDHEQADFEKEIIQSLRNHFALVYLFDRKDNAIYRYDRMNGQFYKTGENTEPGLMTLIEDPYKNAFADFLHSTGHRQISTRIWNAETSEYREMIAIAGSYNGKEEIEQILLIDSTAAKNKYESDIRALKEKIEELNGRVELAEDEEHRVFMSTNELMNEIIARKSHESKTHLQHIKSYVEIILREISRRHPELAMDEDKIRELSEASLLHDIGKIEIPDRILNKIDTLTPEEYEEMKKHTVYGAQLINKMPYVKKYETIMKYALEIALHHHERFDGNGYPDGLKGDQIPLFVQAAALADAYEALTSNRIYRAGIPHEEACKMLHEGKCGAFSEEMLDVLDSVGNELRDNHYRIETSL